MINISDPAYVEYTMQRLEHWDGIAAQFEKLPQGGNYYHKRLMEIYKFLVTPGQRVLEIGCAQGDLLSGLAPSYGVGIDFSPKMVSKARELHPDLTFIQADAHQFSLAGVFDVVILSDLINDLWDVQSVLEAVTKVSAPHTRVILNFYSRLWELPLNLMRGMKIAKPVLYQNWLTVEDTINLLDLAGFEVIRHWEEVLLPLPIPLLADVCNRFLVKLPLLRYLALTNLLIARPQPGASVPGNRPAKPSVSVIVPARNEAGNISQIFDRTPDIGGGTELIFVEGHSNDNTYETIQETMVKYPRTRCKLLKQTGKGKGDAVRMGFAEAEGDILMILDADLTVPPEDLPRFYEALLSDKADFANGVRLIYPMEKEAMRFFNFLGNKFFSLSFSWLLGQSIKDTLCGTKVLWKRDYERIAANRAYFGDFDPFGDFDLLFGAAKLDLKIVDLPIRYRERVYGSTNISRWKHGWLLLKMVLFAAGRIKFV